MFSDEPHNTAKPATRRQWAEAVRPVIEYTKSQMLANQRLIEAIITCSDNLRTITEGAWGNLGGSPAEMRIKSAFAYYDSLSTEPLMVMLRALPYQLDTQRPDLPPETIVKASERSLEVARLSYTNIAQLFNDIILLAKSPAQQNQRVIDLLRVESILLDNQHSEWFKETEKLLGSSRQSGQAR